MTSSDPNSSSVLNTALNPKVQAVRWQNQKCVLIDQKCLPGREETVVCKSATEVASAIADLTVRGAPAIGVAGAYGVVLAAKEAAGLPSNERRTFFETSLEKIAKARPTAVNLAWAVKRMRQEAGDLDRLDEKTLAVLERAAIQIHTEDIEFNRKILGYGTELFSEKGPVLTYCNTGDLATGGIGTAFGVVHGGFRAGRVSHVFACETRPVLQGIRLTAWELKQNEIPFTVICDNMVACVMREKNIKAVIVGADRIASNGDAANKVGTYAAAISAHYHGVPFYVAAPSSTFDLELETGEQIPIEERNGEEILSVLAERRGDAHFPVYNPAFDVTPAKLITAIICEKGVISSPTTEKVRACLGH